MERPTDDVKYLGGYLLLTSLIVFKGKGLQEVIAVVRGGLHGDCAGGMLGGVAVQEDGIYLKTLDFRDKDTQDSRARGLDNDAT